MSHILTCTRVHRQLRLEEDMWYMNILHISHTTHHISHITYHQISCHIVEHKGSRNKKKIKDDEHHEPADFFLFVYSGKLVLLSPYMVRSMVSWLSYMERFDFVYGTTFLYQSINQSLLSTLKQRQQVGDFLLLYCTFDGELNFSG